MGRRRQVSRAAIELVARFEGFRRKAGQLPDGRWTVGYGHTQSAREGAVVSEADAEALLIYDLMGVAAALDELIYAPLTQNQFDALAAFAFSVGLPAFRESDVLKHVNQGAMIQAAYAIELWRRAEFAGESLVIDALVRRRAAEKLLFLTPPQDAWPAAPSAMLRPQFDSQTPDTTPDAEPVVLIPDLDGELAEVAREPVPESAEVLPPTPEATGDEAAAPVEEPRSASPQLEEATLEAAPEEDAIPRILRRESEAFGEPIRVDSAGPWREPIATQPTYGVPAIVVVLLLGLIFFGGGIYWATHGPLTPRGIFTPLLTGWLAGVAGAGFIASAAFMVLQRLARAEQKRERRRRG
jgi:lysozyme